METTSKGKTALLVALKRAIMRVNVCFHSGKNNSLNIFMFKQFNYYFQRDVAKTML